MSRDTAQIFYRCILAVRQAQWQSPQGFVNSLRMRCVAGSINHYDRSTQQEPTSEREVFYHRLVHSYSIMAHSHTPRLRGRSTAPSHSHVHAFTLTHPSPSGSQRSAFTLAHTPSHSHTPRLHTHTPLAFRIASQRTTSHTADGMSLLYALRTGVLRRTRMRVQTIDLR